MTPQISVVIPTYNRESTLPRAIRSILAQTFQNWELIVVDDCSTDKTEDIVKYFSLNDNRINYFRLHKNSGANAARNMGATLAKSRIVSFLDSDDEMHPMNLEQQVFKFSSNANLALCYVGADIYINEKFIVTKHPKVKGSLETYLFNDLKGLGSSTSGFSIKKEVLENIGGFDQEMRSQQDLDIMVRIARNHYIDFIDDCSTKMHQNADNRISSNSKSVIIGEYQFLTKHEQRLRELGIYHYVARKLARKYVVYAKDLKSAYKYLFKAIRFKPSCIYSYIYMFKLPLLYLKK